MTETAPHYIEKELEYISKNIEREAAKGEDRTQWTLSKPCYKEPVTKAIEEKGYKISYIDDHSFYIIW